MTPVEELREAIRLIRERAQAATPGPWTSGQEYHGRDITDEGYSYIPVNDARGRVLVDLAIESDRPREDAAHIASWHPQVALAVADWLEVTARDVGTSSLAFHSALAVARAYLSGGAS